MTISMTSTGGKLYFDNDDDTGQKFDYDNDSDTSGLTVNQFFRWPTSDIFIY